jgi:hypothetical protein
MEAAMNAKRPSPTATTITIVVAAIAAIGSLIGVLLSSHSSSENMKAQLESQGENIKTQLENQSGAKEADVRREVYAEYVAAVINVEFTIGTEARRHGTNKNERDLKVTDPRVTEAIATVFTKFSRVMLIGSPAAIEKALLLLSEDLDKLLTNIERHHNDRASKSFDQLTDHLVDFLNTVRPELKISSPLLRLPD